MSYLSCKVELEIVIAERSGNVHKTGIYPWLLWLFSGKEKRDKPEPVQVNNEGYSFETPTMSFESFLTYDEPTPSKKKKKLSRPSQPVAPAASASSKSSKANESSVKRPATVSTPTVPTPEKRKKVQSLGQWLSTNMSNCWNTVDYDFLSWEIYLLFLCRNINLTFFLHILGYSSDCWCGAHSTWHSFASYSSQLQTPALNRCHATLPTETQRLTFLFYVYFLKT